MKKEDNIADLLNLVILIDQLFLVVSTSVFQVIKSANFYSANFFQLLLN